jgi:hypothetical protein
LDGYSDFEQSTTTPWESFDLAAWARLEPCKALQGFEHAKRLNLDLNSSPLPYNILCVRRQDHPTIESTLLRLAIKR